MLYSLDINGYRAKRPVTHLTDDVESALKNVKLDGVIVSQTGDIVQIEDSFRRMLKAIGLGVVILIMSLIAIYKSVRMSFIMILVLPLSHWCGMGNALFWKAKLYAESLRNTLTFWYHYQKCSFTYRLLPEL
jgi:multidrug efflux pump subunit AcrB